MQTKEIENAGVENGFYEGWPNHAAIEVGIDPSGRTDQPMRREIIWSGDLIARGQWNSDTWYSHSTDFGAQAERASVWLRVTQRRAGAKVRLSIDDVVAEETP